MIEGNKTVPLHVIWLQTTGRYPVHVVSLERSLWWLGCFYLKVDFSFILYIYMQALNLFWFWIVNVSVLLSASVHCSYQWIKRKGKPAPREIAPIIVSNHVSYIEPIFYFYELFPTIVAAESHDSIPFVGTIIRAMQVISFHGYILCMPIWNLKI